MPDEQKSSIPQKQPDEQKTAPPQPNLPSQQDKTVRVPNHSPQPKFIQAKPSLPGKEKLEFLKRTDVRTMSKDSANLRAQEAAKERKRSESLASQKVSKTKRVREKEIADYLLSGNHTEIPQPKSQKAPSRFDKLFIRILVILILLFSLGNIVALAYYWFVVSR